MRESYARVRGDQIQLIKIKWNMKSSHINAMDDFVGRSICAQLVLKLQTIRICLTDFFLYYHSFFFFNYKLFRILMCFIWIKEQLIRVSVCVCVATTMFTTNMVALQYASVCSWCIKNGLQSCDWIFWSRFFFMHSMELYVHANIGFIKSTYRTATK